MKNISIDQLHDRLSKKEKINLIDVREPWEYEQFNLGGKNVPLSEIPGRMDELENLKNEEIVIHCQSGNRSRQAGALLEQMGFKNVVNVSTGTDDWKKKFGSQKV